MNSFNNQQPPYYALAFFRWFCNPEYREDIEGDLVERFHQQIATQGLQKARWLFVIDVLRLFRPAIIKNHELNLFTPMTKKNWTTLTAIHALLFVVIILPFLPGPPNKLVIVLSALAQATGFIGLLVVPIGLVWAIVEIREWRKKETATGTSPYNLAMTATAVVGVICLFLIIGLTINAGWIVGIFTLGLAAFQLRWAMLAIKKRRNSPDKKISMAPIYLVTIPLVALLIRLYVVLPFSDYSRDIAIQKSESLIASIEEYKNKVGHYPESIQDLKTEYMKEIPSSSIMGILDFRYNKIEDNYSISFSQWLEMGSLEEIVLYDRHDVKNNLYGKFAKYDYNVDLWRVKGAFASHDTQHPYWRYYSLD